MNFEVRLIWLGTVILILLVVAVYSMIAWSLTFQEFWFVIGVLSAAVPVVFAYLYTEHVECRRRSWHMPFQLQRALLSDLEAGREQDYRDVVGTWCYNNGRSRLIVKKADGLQFVQYDVPVRRLARKKRTSNAPDHGTVKGVLIATLDDGVEWMVASLPLGVIRLRRDSWANDAVLSQFKFSDETCWSYDVLATKEASPVLQTAEVEKPTPSSSRLVHGSDKLPNHLNCGDTPTTAASLNFDISQAKYVMVEYVFEPGKLAAALNEKGDVIEVARGGQADCTGIEAGMRFCSVAGQVFSHDVLRMARNGSESFTVVVSQERAKYEVEIEESVSSSELIEEEFEDNSVALTGERINNGLRRNQSPKWMRYSSGESSEMREEDCYQDDVVSSNDEPVKHDKIDEDFEEHGFEVQYDEREDLESFQEKAMAYMQAIEARGLQMVTDSLSCVDVQGVAVIGKDEFQALAPHHFPIKIKAKFQSCLE